MDREILFRGKDDNNNWCYGYAIIGKRFKWASILPIDTIDDAPPMFDECEVELDTVGQYTGLKDKNGTKIFEGDIIKIPEDWDKYGINAGELFEVYFDYGGFRLKPKIYKDCRGYWLEDDGEFEIISNVHDNPELLEETTNVDY